MGGKFQLPFDPSFFSEIKLGKGVAGKVASLAAVLVIGFILASCILLFTGSYVLGSVFLLLAGAFAFYAIERVMRFSEKNPGIALLEGAQFVKYEELQKASTPTIIIDNSAQPTANTAPPLSLPRGDNSNG